MNWPYNPLNPGLTLIQCLRYQLILQGVSPNGLITMSPTVEVNVPITNDLASGITPVVVPPSTNQQQFPLMRPDFIDFLAVFPMTGPISLQLNALADIPKVVRAGGIFLLDGQTISGLWLSNPGPSPITVGVVQGRGQSLP